MPRISIIGRGVDPAKHLTLEAIRALQMADRIVGVESEIGFWLQLKNDFNIPDIEDIGTLYSSHDNDMVNYHRFVDHIIQLSFKCSHLALLIAGHPRLGVTFIELLKKTAPDELEIVIIEGISSFDVMMNFVELDPLEQGTTLLDANRLLLFQYTLEPALSYFIYHICSVGNSVTDFINPSSENKIELLKNYLVRYYKKDKEVFLCRMSNGQNEISSTIRTTIFELDVLKIDFSTTLYLPANDPVKLDWNFLNLLR